MSEAMTVTATTAVDALLPVGRQTRPFGRGSVSEAPNTDGLAPRYLRERAQRAATEAAVVQPPAADELQLVFRSMDALTPQLRRRVTDVGAARPPCLLTRRLLATVTLRRRRATDAARVTPRQLVTAVTLPILAGLTLLLWLGH
jgi:hypothetical protein